MEISGETEIVRKVVYCGRCKFISFGFGMAEAGNLIPCPENNEREEQVRTFEEVLASCSPITSSTSASSVVGVRRSLVPYGSPKHSWSEYRGGKTSQSNRAHPLLPVASSTHYSDSGFGSTLSSGSSSSYLPPPPPYRMNVRRQHRIHRSLSDSKYGTGHTADPYHISTRHSWGFSRVRAGMEKRGFGRVLHGNTH